MDEDDAMWDEVGEVGMTDEAIESLLRTQASDLVPLTPAPPPPEPEVPSLTTFALESALSAEQRAILKLVQSGRNVFFTGSAGTQHAANTGAL